MILTPHISLSAEVRAALQSLHERAVAARSESTSAYLSARLERDAVFAVAILGSEGFELSLPADQGFDQTVGELAQQVGSASHLTERGEAARVLLTCVARAYPALQRGETISPEIAEACLIIGHAVGRLGLAEQGYTPEVAALASTAVSQRVGGERGRQASRTRADTWRAPLSDYADAWLDRRKPATKEHGLIGRVVADFRKAQPTVALPTSDGPNRLVKARLTAYLDGKSGM